MPAHRINLFAPKATATTQQPPPPSHTSHPPPTFQAATSSKNNHTTITTSTLPAAVEPRRGSIINMDAILHFNKDKRKSLTPRLPSHKGKDKGSPKGSPKLGPQLPAKLEIEVQSPPLIFHGSTQNSTGALLGGQLHLSVTEPSIKIQSLTMHLIARVTTKKPVAKDCANCKTKSNEMHTWEFLSEPKTYTHADHTIPFSHLLPGHLTASVSGPLGSIEYLLSAKAVTSSNETLTATHPLSVKRALQPPVLPRHSQRVFPPTHLKTDLTHPPVVHPIGEFSCHFRLTGIVNNTDSANFRWKLRRLTWKIHEHSKIISPVCSKHAAKIGGENKGIAYTDARLIGEKDLKDGWKTDWSEGGMAEIEFNAFVKPSLNPICDVENPTGLSVTHKLAIELIVAEEVSPKKSPNSWSATGTARVLRTQHSIVITERAGMGISWDEEMPPMYEDVPESPPGYIKVTEGTWDSLGMPGGLASPTEETPPRGEASRSASATPRLPPVDRLDLGEAN